MGIKTTHFKFLYKVRLALKNLPTTWGLRQIAGEVMPVISSEKPPHHMGIKTFACTLLS